MGGDYYFFFVVIKIQVIDNILLGLLYDQFFGVDVIYLLIVGIFGNGMEGTFVEVDIYNLIVLIGY